MTTVSRVEASSSFEVVLKWGSIESGFGLALKWESIDSGFGLAPKRESTDSGFELAPKRGSIASGFELEPKRGSIERDFGLVLSASICESRMEVLALKLKDLGGLMAGDRRGIVDWLA